MKRLVLALLLFIFKHLAIAPALTPDADITLVNPSMFAREGIMTSAVTTPDVKNYKNRYDVPDPEKR